MDRYAEHFQQCGMPRPEIVSLPPVQLKGFNGLRSNTRKGMKWTVQIGQLLGNDLPGAWLGPFLPSRRVLEGMAATLDLGRGTISSEKHGMRDVSLRQASSGHLLLPLTPPAQDEFQAACVEPVQAQHVELDSIAIADLGPADGSLRSALSEEAGPRPGVDVRDPPKDKPPKTTMSDVKRQFQTVLKHTRYTRVDVGTYQGALNSIFGQAVDITMCAYCSRFERVPKQAASQAVCCSVATLNTEGELTVSPLSERPPSAKRAPYSCTGTCLFAYRLQRPVLGECSPSPRKPNAGVQAETPSSTPQDYKMGLQVLASTPVSSPVAACLCKNEPVSDSEQREDATETCNAVTSTKPESSLREGEPRRPVLNQCDCAMDEAFFGKDPSAECDDPSELAAMNEDVDWVALEHLPMSSQSR